MELVESLEETKRTATNVSEQVKAAKESEVGLNAAREVYRPVAARGALLYFLIDSLPSLDRVYYFSMANFSLIMQKGRVLQPEVNLTELASTNLSNLVCCGRNGFDCEY